MWKRIRIAILLFVLILVGSNAWLTRLRTSDWKRPLWVAIYPINADGRDVSKKYVANVSPDTYAPIAIYLAQQARHYNIALETPIEIKLAPEIDELPPPVPASRNPISVAFWSLHLRWWAWQHNNLPGAKPDIQIYVLYHDPQTSPRLAHSLGLQKGLIGVVNAFATRGMAGSNNVVITHELLHTLGATDKYDPATNLPLFPDGFVEPKRQPLYPQRYAEIMAGRIPLAADEAEIPAALKYTAIGPITATEIGWK